MPTESATQQIQTEPKLFTYTLFIEANPASTTGKLVRIEFPDMFWKGVHKGDQVQFVPAPTIAASVKDIEVEFRPTKEPRPACGPFGDWSTKVTDQSPQTVTTDTVPFTAMCWMTTSDGVWHGCATGGHVTCGGGLPCP